MAEIMLQSAIKCARYALEGVAVYLRKIIVHLAGLAAVVGVGNYVLSGGLASSHPVTVCGGVDVALKAAETRFASIRGAQLNLPSSDQVVNYETDFLILGAENCTVTEKKISSLLSCVVEPSGGWFDTAFMKVKAGDDLAAEVEQCLVTHNGWKRKVGSDNIYINGKYTISVLPEVIDFEVLK